MTPKEKLAWLNKMNTHLPLGGVKTWQERQSDRGPSYLNFPALMQQEIDELRAEVLRLAGEVSNRNALALEGDKAQVAFNLLYAEHEKLQVALRECRTLLGEALQESKDATVELVGVRQQKPVARFNWYAGKFEWLVPYRYELHNMKPLYLAAGAQPAPEAKNIATAPDCLNTNDKAFWVTGWNECRLAMLKGMNGAK